MQPAEFWQRLDARITGVMTLHALEKAAGLGKSSLQSGRERQTMPTLDTVLPVCRVLNCTAQDLLAEATPEELRTPQADPALRRIPFLQLTASHLNPRRTIDAAGLRELADSIEAQGLLQNLVVRQDQDQQAIYWIVAGERRFRALEILAKEQRLPPDIAANGVPCQVKQLTDAEHMAMALLENMQRQDVNPMEEAEALAKLHAMDPKRWSTKSIAEKLGVTQRHVQLRLALANKLHEDGRNMLKDGTINLQQARLIAAMTPLSQVETLENIQKGYSEHEDRLLDQLTDSMMDPDLALFDVPSSGLELWEDPNSGKSWLKDGDAAMDLQRAAVQKKLKALQQQKTASFIKIEEGWFSEYDYPKGGTGIVAALGDNGEVAFHEGRRDRRAEEAAASKRTPAEAKATADRAQALYKAGRRWDTAHAEAVTALRQALAEDADYMDMQRILIWHNTYQGEELLCQEWHGLRIDLDDAPDTPYGRVALAMGASPADKAADTRWASLIATKENTVDRAAIAIVMHRLNIQPGKPLHQVIAAVAEITGITIPPRLLQTAKQRKAQIDTWADEDGQLDIEDAIAAAGAPEEAEQAA